MKLKSIFTPGKNRLKSLVLVALENIDEISVKQVVPYLSEVEEHRVEHAIDYDWYVTRFLNPNLREPFRYHSVVERMLITTI